MDNQLSKEANNFLGSGWSFPVSFAMGTGEVKTTQYEDNVNENIKVLLNTPKGEHLMEPEYGSGLQQFMFRKMDEELKGEIIDTVKYHLLTYEPRIKVLKVEVTYEDVKQGTLHIHISYEYNQTNTRHNYVFPFNLKEATNLPG